jgi:hypothetical protein
LWPIKTILCLKNARLRPNQVVWSDILV